MIFGKFQISAGTVCKINRSMQTHLGKIDRWGKLTIPVRAKEISAAGVPMEELLLLLDWDKGLLYHSKRKTRNQRMRISLLLSHPVCDLIKEWDIHDSWHHRQDGKGSCVAQFILLQLSVDMRWTSMDIHDLSEKGARYHDIYNLKLWHHPKTPRDFKVSLEWSWFPASWHSGPQALFFNISIANMKM